MKHVQSNVGLFEREKVLGLAGRRLDSFQHPILRREGSKEFKSLNTRLVISTDKKNMLDNTYLVSKLLAECQEWIDLVKVFHHLNGH